MKLSIIIPVYNEVKYLKNFTKNLTDAFIDENVEYIFVNDGSNDGSGEWLSNYVKNAPEEKFKFIKLEKNFGKGFALIQGTKASTGDYILFQDSDMELDPRDSLEMYHIIKNNNEMEVLFGSRFLSGKLKTNKNYLNEIIGRVNSVIFNVFFLQSLSDLHCGTKIISRKVLNKINLTVKDFGIEIDIASQISKNNFLIYEYGISYFGRSHGEGKKITWVDGLLSYYYLVKTRFIDNDISILLSIIYSIIYMVFVASYFGEGNGKNLIMILFFIIGSFIGLHKKIAISSIIFLSAYLGSLFSSGNGKIYTVLLGFLIGLYISKKIYSKLIHNTKNKFIKFFV